MNRPLLLTFALVVTASLSIGLTCRPSGQPHPDLVQRVEVLPGFVEVHTPGSGAPEEFAASTPVQNLLGPGPDLNQVTYIRTAFESPGAPPPSAVIVFIPGFLGGGTTFDPLARDLVSRFNGSLEVWSVDRRPNQLEDRLGAQVADAGATDPECSGPPLPSCSIFRGAQFYFADLDQAPLGDFPGPADLDINLNGVLDSALPLQDGFGVTRGPVLMTQDDVRFMAHWGLDAYFRDWKILIEEARQRVGPNGVVLLGGHSQGTTWATTFAAYDFDPDPASVVAGHQLVDGLILLEGGGNGPGSSSKPTLAEYQAQVSSLETAGGPDVFLRDFGPIALQDLGTVGEVSSLAAFHQPDEPALVQRTPTFGTGLLASLLGAPSTNQTVVGLFLDDDFSSFGAFRASMGFTDDGPNALLGPPFVQLPIWVARPKATGLRTWKDADDLTLPACPPGTPGVSPGCAILDNGPPSDPNDPNDPPRVNGLEREVTRVDDFTQTQFGKANGFEWYFAAGRPNLDFSYGNDSSALVGESLAADPTDEGPLVVTQQSTMALPVLAIGGSNGLTPEPKSFSRYLSSIATPVGEQRVHIIEGYAHVDVLTATQNEVVPLVEDFTVEIQQQKLLSNF